jgi:hypothetical protein
MVFYSEQAENDLNDILKGLLNWEKFTLTREFCLNYVSDLIDVCDSLDTITKHFKAIYETHKRYGENIHRYSRNKTTTWYIIYNIFPPRNIFIEKIISNHLTIK